MSDAAGGSAGFVTCGVRCPIDIHYKVPSGEEFFTSQNRHGGDR